MQFTEGLPISPQAVLTVFMMVWHLLSLSKQLFMLVFEVNYAFSLTNKVTIIFNRLLNFRLIVANSGIYVMFLSSNKLMYFSVLLLSLCPSNVLTCKKLCLDSLYSLLALNRLKSYRHIVFNSGKQNSSANRFLACRYPS